MTTPKVVAGLSCTDVLDKLSHYVDATDLTEDERARIELHLRGCTWCERFGGAFSEMVAALRKELAKAPEVPADVVERLNARLREDG